LLHAPSSVSLAQILAMIHAFPHLDEQLPWATMYGDASDWAPTHSLSEIAFDLVNRYIQEQNPELQGKQGVRSREEDAREGRWSLFLPVSNAGNVIPPLKPAQSPARNTRNMTHTQAFGYLRERILMTASPTHITPHQGIKKLYENWETLEAAVKGKRVLAPLNGAEIDGDDRCQNDCGYCHPFRLKKPLAWFTTESHRNMVKGIFGINSDAFIRESGVTGDPFVRRDLHEVYRGLPGKGGVITNGVALFQQDLVDFVLERMIYAIIGIDAIDEESYLNIKLQGKGSPGRFKNVMAVIKKLVDMKALHNSSTLIIPSFLVQKGNYKGVAKLSDELEVMGVDGFQIKNEHFDPTRPMMTEEEIDKAYDLIEALQRRNVNPRYRVMVVQDRAKAHEKAGHSQSARPSPFVQIETTLAAKLRVPFSKCWDSILGGGFTLGPLGPGASAAAEVFMCCHGSFDETIGRIGVTTGDDLEKWVGVNSPARLNAAHGHFPFNECRVCPPASEMINEIVESLVDFYPQFGQSILDETRILVETLYELVEPSWRRVSRSTLNAA